MSCNTGSKVGRHAATGGEIRRGAGAESRNFLADLGRVIAASSRDLEAVPNAYEAVSAPTLFIDTAAARFAYRLLGHGEGPPLALSQRFGGTMDDWDPALLQSLSSRRRILLFDAPGIGRSGGETADSFTGLAKDVATLFEALGFDEVDLLGWSMGGYLASHLAILYPERVRRLILASSGPGFVEQAPLIPSGPAPASLSPDESYLHLNFPLTAEGRSAGEDHLARLNLRADRWSAPQRPESARAQLASRALVMTSAGSLIHKMPFMTLPVLVAGGLLDSRLPSDYCLIAAQTLPSAKLILYPGAGHGFIFQMAREFSDDLQRFLSSNST